MEYYAFQIGNRNTSFQSRDHCLKSVRIRGYSGPHFPAFGLNTDRYGISFRIQSECGKMRTRITPNTVWTLFTQGITD